MYLSPRKKLFVDTAAEMFGDGAIISKQNVREAAEKAGVPFPTWFMKPAFKAHYGSYKLPGEETPASVVSTTDPAGDATTVNLIATSSYKQDLVPAKFEGFVEWGHFATLN